MRRRLILLWRLSTRDYKPSKPERGAHGFDLESPEMAAIFVASGPGIRRGVALPTFANVSVYPLLARLLGARPRRTTGGLARCRRRWPGERGVGLMI